MAFGMAGSANPVGSWQEGGHVADVWQANNCVHWPLCRGNTGAFGMEGSAGPPGSWQEGGGVSDGASCARGNRGGGGVSAWIYTTGRVSRLLPAPGLLNVLEAFQGRLEIALQHFRAHEQVHLALLRADSRSHLGM
jgi:hypothetical protein